MGHKSLRFAFYGLRDVSKTREKSVRDDILNKLYNDGLLENLSKKNLENIFNMNLEQLEKLYSLYPAILLIFYRYFQIQTYLIL